MTPYDTEALTDKIQAALDGRLSAAQADPASLAELDWTSVARRYIELYSTALRGAGPRGVVPAR